jgi:hypothetical protein
VLHPISHSSKFSALCLSAIQLSILHSENLLLNRIIREFRVRKVTRVIIVLGLLRLLTGWNTCACGRRPSAAARSSHLEGLLVMMMMVVVVVVVGGGGGGGGDGGDDGGDDDDGGGGDDDDGGGSGGSGGGGDNDDDGT